MAGKQASQLFSDSYAALSPAQPGSQLEVPVIPTTKKNGDDWVTKRSKIAQSGHRRKFSYLLRRDDDL